MGLAHVVEDVVDIEKRQGSFLDGVNSFFGITPRQTKGQVTVIAVTTMTAPKTFTGDAIYVTQTGDPVAGGAVFASRTDAAPTQAAATSWYYYSYTEPTTQYPSQTSVASTPTSSLSPITPTGSKVNAGAAVTSAATSPSPESKQADNGGMSGGAKAGIAFGVLIPLAALLIGALIFMRRKKQQKEAGERLMDNEKANPFGSAPAQSNYSAPAVAAAPPMASQNQPPQLSLRPVTQFDPRMSKLAGPGPSVGAVGLAAGHGAGALGAAAAGNRSPSHSAWEKRGAERNANDPANPFGDHAVNSSQAAMAPAAARAPSPANIDASDFPLPASAAPSEKAMSLAPNSSADNLSLAPSNPATTSNLSLAAPAAAVPGGPAGAAVLAAGAAGAAGAVAAAAGAKRNSPPPSDNVYRVQLDFKPSMEDELEIRAGQLVRCLHEYDDGWALCMRMDRSQQGVVPRTCLSKNTVKPRQGPPPGARPGPGPGPGPRGPMPAGSPQMRGPPGGRNSPAPGYGPPGRPMTPQGGRNSPAPYAQQPRPMSPAGARPRANSNAPAPYAAYAPQGRSQSPGPYGAPGQMRPPQRPDMASRRRSNSMGNITPPKTLSPTGVSRKPVPGQAV